MIYGGVGCGGDGSVARDGLGGSGAAEVGSESTPGWGVGVGVGGSVGWLLCGWVDCGGSVGFEAVGEGASGAEAVGVAVLVEEDGWGGAFCEGGSLGQLCHPG